jgi:hypothetical protein
VGWLFVNWIVDASIFAMTLHHGVVAIINPDAYVMVPVLLRKGSGLLVCSGLVFVVDDCPLCRLASACWGGGWCGGLLLFLLSVCETSYEGHMVDALASRADEGRRSLR